MWEQYEPLRDGVLCLDDAQGSEPGTLVEINGVDYAVGSIQALNDGGFKIYRTPVGTETTDGRAANEDSSEGSSKPATQI